MYVVWKSVVTGRESISTETDNDDGNDNGDDDNNNNMWIQFYVLKKSYLFQNSRRQRRIRKIAWRLATAVRTAADLQHFWWFECVELT